MIIIILKKKWLKDHLEWVQLNPWKAKRSAMLDTFRIDGIRVGMRPLIFVKQSRVWGKKTNNSWFKNIKITITTKIIFNRFFKTLPANSTTLPPKKNYLCSGILSKAQLIARLTAILINSVAPTNWNLKNKLFLLNYKDLLRLTLIHFIDLHHHYHQRDILEVNHKNKQIKHQPLKLKLWSKCKRS